MSGVFIKGMEMPTSCFQCEFRTKIDPDNLMCIISQKTFEDRFYHIEHRDESCPLVPVPDHGRLIDADALWKEEKSADALHKLRPKGESVIYDAGFLAGYRAAAQIASKMPTIIPKEAEAGE